MKNQEGGSSTIVLTLAGVIITGIIGSMAYSMVDDVDNRQTMGQGQMNGSEVLGKGIAQGVHAFKNRPKDDKDDDDFNISNMKCSVYNYALAAENEQPEFQNICIREISLMSKKIDEILNDLKGEGIHGYVKYLIERKKKYVNTLLTKLKKEGAANDFFEDKDFINLMNWYEIINRNKDPKEDMLKILEGTQLEDIISYDELFKNERIADYVHKKSGDIIEYKDNSYNTKTSWDPVDKEYINDDDFYMVKVGDDKGYLINFAPKKVDVSFPQIDSDVNKPVMDALNGLRVLDVVYYKLKEEEPEDLKLKHLGKILVYMLKNKKGFFSNVSNVFSRKNSKNDTVEGNEGERGGPTHIKLMPPSAVVDVDETYEEDGDKSDGTVKPDEKYEKFLDLLKGTTIDKEELQVYVDKKAKEIKDNIKRGLLKQTGPAPAEEPAAEEPAAEEPAAEEPAEEPAPVPEPRVEEPAAEEPAAEEPEPAPSPAPVPESRVEEPAAEPQKKTARFYGCNTSADCEEPNPTCKKNICVSVKEYQQ